MIYNLDKIQEMAEGDEEFTISVISVFLDEVPADLYELEKSLGLKDYEAVYKLAHKIKPNVDLLGMEQARAVALQIETLGRNGENNGEIERLLPLLKKDIHQVISELKNDFKL